jgi:hypothetical protein
LLHAARAARRNPGEHTLSALLAATQRIEELPPLPHPRLARLAHRQLLRNSGVDSPRRSLHWPTYLRANAACIRAGYNAPSSDVDTACALGAMLSSQSSFLGRPLPAQSDRDGRLQFFWSAVASDKALAAYWTRERCESYQKQDLSDFHFVHLAGTQALACISQNRASPDRVRAMDILAASEPRLLGPFSRLAQFPIASSERWLYEGWPSDLSALASDLAAHSPTTLLDLLCLAFNPPLRLAAYHCPQTGISLLDSVASLATPATIEAHHGALQRALGETPRTDIPAELREASEAYGLRAEMEIDIALPEQARRPLRV